MSSNVIEPGPATRWQLGFALAMLLVTLMAGAASAWVFVHPERLTWLPFERLRPIHVSAALFWILGAAMACAMHFAREVFADASKAALARAGTLLWLATAIAILACHALGWFGGREYWEFPPLLAIPLLLAWLALSAPYFHAWWRQRADAPLYVWMWGTGLAFFLIAFAEQNLHLVSWFRDDYVRGVTVQWKSNGSLVGAWNQLVYGTSLFVMVKLTGDGRLARNWRAQAFFLLSLTNLMFNWGHHIYNVPTAGWIRHLSYAISMTEWIFFIAILRDFRSKLDERQRLGHLTTYRHLFAAEMWLFANLLLALLMSIPAINRYTHGTHITVAHAMGTTIGINTMLLLGAISHLLAIDRLPERRRRRIARWHGWTQCSLLVFWLALIVAGLLKGYREVVMDLPGFHAVMLPVHGALVVAAMAGIGLLLGLAMIAIDYLQLLCRPRIAH